MLWIGDNFGQWETSDICVPATLLINHPLSKGPVANDDDDDEQAVFKLDGGRCYNAGFDPEYDNKYPNSARRNTAGRDILRCCRASMLDKPEAGALPMYHWPGIPVCCAFQNKS